MPGSARDRWAGNELTERLGIDRPVLSGAFGGLSSVELTVAVSEAGGLGAYGLYGYGPERILQTCAALRAATARPFLVNLWVVDESEARAEIAPARLTRHAAALHHFFEELGVQPPPLPDRILPAFADQVDAVVEAAPPAVSFVYGAPEPATVTRLKRAGIFVLGTATTVAEAIALESVGVEAIVASGAEAGGHKVSFLRPAEQSLVGSLALVPQVADAVSVPVVAAGGIADGRGIAAALMLGAHAVQVGTAFLATKQSAAPESYRAAILSSRSRETVLTRASSGRLARGIPNRLTELPDESIAPFPLQNWLTGTFRRIAAQNDQAELMALWCGQAGPLATETDATALFHKLVAQTEELLS